MKSVGGLTRRVGNACKAIHQIRFEISGPAMIPSDDCGKSGQRNQIAAGVECGVRTGSVEILDVPRKSFAKGDLRVQSVALARLQGPTQRHAPTGYVLSRHDVAIKPNVSKHGSKLNMPRRCLVSYATDQIRQAVVVLARERKRDVGVRLRCIFDGKRKLVLTRVGFLLGPRPRRFFSTLRYSIPVVIAVSPYAQPPSGGI